MHVSFLCFASYYIPDFGCCRPKFIFHAVSSCSSSLNTCSVELLGGRGFYYSSKMASSTKHSTSKCLGIAEE